MSENLRVCPFCGGRAQMSKSADDERNGYAEHFQVSCTKCFSRAEGATYWPFGDNRLPSLEATEKAAADNWNRRHQEQDQSSTFERLLSK